MTPDSRTPHMETLESVFEQWMDRNVAGDVDGICALYREDALFWGTLAPFLCTNQEDRRRYFHTFFNPPPFKILHHHSVVRVYGTIGMNTGSYTFYFQGDHGIRHIDARYSFAYEQQPDGRWLIVDHHSSSVPDCH